ncbi:hypothetical protein [Ferruginibacter sp.]
MKCICLLLSFLSFQTIFSQTKLPVIKASSRSVTINDDGFVDKGGWNLAPKIRPDIYTADRTRKTKWVIFYTDIDSIKVKLKPGATFDFIVLLNGKDSCYTQIASAIPPAEKNPSTKNDTIPFTLTSYNVISVKAVINDRDTLQLHFDASSSNCRLTKEAILKKTSLLAAQPGVAAGTANPDYNKLAKVFKLQLGNTIFTDPVVAATGITAQEMDGRFGWNMFEGRQVEIDYDHYLLIVHNIPVQRAKGYTKVPLHFIRSFPCVPGSFIISGKKYSSDFMLDTGSSTAIILDSSWAAEQNFPDSLPLIKTSVLRDPRGNQYKTRLVRFPQFSISDHSLSAVPTLILGSKNPADFKINFFGNDLLKRFNIILDFKNDLMYLKPNGLMNTTYRDAVAG